MTTRRTKVLLSLLAVATLGFSMVNAYTFFVENRNPFGALNLTKLIIKASPEDQTGMELSNFKLQINTAGGQLNVHKICDENGEHCRDVDVLYTWTQGNQWPQWNTWAHVVTWYVSWNDIVFGLSDDSTITLANIISQISSTWPQWDTWAQWATWAYIVSWQINGNDIIFTLSDDTTITIQNIIQAITWPQGNTWANWTWIHHISTWYDEENWITTVNIYYTTDTETPAVSFQIHDWTDWVWGNLDPDDFDWIYALFRLNDANHSGYVSAPGGGNSGKVWKTSADGTPSWQDDATGGYELPVASEDALWGIKLGYVRNDNDRNYPVKLSDGKAFVNVPWEASEWTEITWENKHWCTYECWIWIPSVTLAWWCDYANNKELCTNKQTEYQERGCVDTNETGADCISIALEINANAVENNDTWFKEFNYDDWGCRVSCFEDEPTCQGQCEWWSTDVEWQHWKRCKYSCSITLDWEVYNMSSVVERMSDVNLDPVTKATLVQIYQEWISWNNPEEVSCKIVCNANGPSSYPTINIEWSMGNICTYVNNRTITCNTDPESLWGDITINWSDSFRKTGSYVSQTMITPIMPHPLYFNQPFYHYGSFTFYTKQNGQYWASNVVTFDDKWIRLWNGQQFFSWAWLSINWGMVLWNWNADNFIYMFATGAYNDDYETKHFEIMWSKELAIWAHTWAYLYFNSADSLIDRSVWINKKDPKATLDVAGSIRISNNCAGSNNMSKVFNCSSSYNNNKWIIMFYNDHFYWCMKSGNVKGRYDLAGGGFYSGTITTDCWYTPFIIETTTQQYFEILD